MRAYVQVMIPTYDLGKEHKPRAIEPTLMFRRRTIWVVYIGANAVGAGLVLWGLANRTALLTPVAPDFRAFMIGLGVFLGILIAAVEREAWLLGAGGRRAPSRGAASWIAMMVLVAASGFGGDFVAKKLWEWRAFHGLASPGVDRVFTIIARHNARSGDLLELQDEAAGPPFTIGCSYRMYLATQVGERIVLAVETGRGGAQRVTLPPLRDLRRA